jgi:hypothetical protein
MSNAADKIVDAFVAKSVARGVPVLAEDNQKRLSDFQARLPRRLPQSFSSLLSRYSFPAFDVAGITLFAWDSAANSYTEDASAPRGSLSEVLIPAGFVQIGRPSTGLFDAVCFDLNGRAQNREQRIVLADHEEILCNRRIRVRELWPSFIRLIESAPDDSISLLD